MENNRNISKAESLSESSLSSDREPLLTVPVLEEFLVTEKIITETGKFILRKTIHTEVKEVEVSSVQENVTVERIPVNRIVESVPETRQEGDVTIIPVVKEVLVVEKKLMLTEEIRLTKSRTITTDTLTATLNKQEVEATYVKTPAKQE